MDTKTSTPATKEDLALTLENTRAVLRSTTKSLIRWMFFFWVLNLITYFVFWLIYK